MSLVLSWRFIHIVCSGKSLSCLPLTIKLHSPSFAFPLVSLLSSSSSHFIPPLNIISDLLTKECGFSSSQVTTVMRRFPKLLRTKSDDTAREVIHLLKDILFNDSELKKVILKNPAILTLKGDRKVKPNMEFLKQLGLATQDIAHIVSHDPRVLGMSIDNCLTPRILHLENLFGSKVHLHKALRKTPQLLTIDFEKQVIPRVEYLKNNIGIQEGSALFGLALNAIISLSFETLEEKTKHMASLGLTKEEICQIVKRYPHIFRMSTKNLKESIDFLIHTAGLEPRIVVSCPTILGFSIEKRLKPRYGVFKSLSTSPHVKGLPSLITFFIVGGQKYLDYVGQYSSNSSLTVIQSPRASILKK